MHKGIKLVWPGVRYRKDDPVTHHVVIRWVEGLPKKRDEPWFVMTDLGGSAVALTTRYGKRMTVEDATRGGKHQFQLEAFLVRSWRSFRRLVWLVAWAFWWLNLWGEAGYAPLREALLSHPWRLPKEVVYLFDWIAQMIRELLHPRPKLQLQPG